MSQSPILMPVFYCSDVQVQRFCKTEALDFDPDSSKSARELFQAARARYGDYRCIDLVFWMQ
jgi:hypothetical protein